MVNHRLTIKRIIFVAIIIALIILVFFMRSYRYAGNNLSTALKNTPQNVLVYVNPTIANKPLISSQTQQELLHDFLRHYFFPWIINADQKANATKKIKVIEKEISQQYLENPGWSENYHHYHSAWIENIVANMDLTHFSLQQFPAITIYATHLRVLPTLKPSFSNPDKAGEGYPFDNLQQSFLPANTPILVLQSSQDHAWDLVLTSREFGWIAARDIADVNKEFMKKWQTVYYVAAIKDNVALMDEAGKFREFSRIGAIYPLVQTNGNDFTVALAAADSMQHAVIINAKLNNTIGNVMPLTITEKNIATMANQMLGYNYGWGDIYSYRDCSSTMMDLFTPFGIWLPRHSGEQAFAGKRISLENLTAIKKSDVLAKNAVPFLTLLHLPGHIMLYIGERHGQQYVFHDFWGLHTENIFGQSGRAIVGRTSITPLNFGENYINIPRTLLQKVDSMTIIGIPVMKSDLKQN